ncbi:MAG: hypothetical protein JO025_02960 [Verrucomicrobia bacterium]|nr:hypothetical protein [Verrucomicrobiota bacterium]
MLLEVVNLVLGVLIGSMVGHSPDFVVFAVAGFLINILERKIICRSLAGAMGLTSHGRFSLT